MADYKLITMALIMISINIVLFLAQGGIQQVNLIEGTNTSLAGVEGSPFYTYATIIDDEAVLTANEQAFSIETSDSVNSDTGNVFTDTFKTVKNWFNTENEKFGIITGVLSQPYGFLKDNDVPSPICTGVGVIWYIMLTLLIVGFLRGGNQ